jgi:hypothetical protein
MVTVSVPPEATVDVAKLSVEVAPLIEPGVTVTAGFVFRVTLLTVTVSVLAVPAVVPVNVAV